jgi:hypothetical protein
MDYHEKAFEYAGETVRQVLTLATGIIALTVTFAHDIIEPGSQALPWMQWAWTLYGISIFFGILTLMAIAGNLNEAATSNTIPNMYAQNIKLFGNLQIWICFLALILTIRFGIIGMNEARQRKAALPTSGVTTHAPFFAMAKTPSFSQLTANQPLPAEQVPGARTGTAP